MGRVGWAHLGAADAVPNGSKPPSAAIERIVVSDEVPKGSNAVAGALAGGPDAGAAATPDHETIGGRLMCIETYLKLDVFACLNGF